MEQYNQSPLSLIDTSFENYVRKRKFTADSHMVNGVPDYAFALDYELRQKLMKVPHLYNLAKKYTATYTAHEIQMMNQQGIAVTPDHFGEIYQMGVDCAHKLGIGVPNIFIINRSDMNAYTYATDQASPVIVLHSGIVERMTPGELKAIIAHECGHIHNEHLVLKYFLTSIIDAGASFAGSLLLTGANLMLATFWTRASEVSCDRASLICCDDPMDAYNAMFKLLYGGMINRDTKMNVDALRDQLEETLNNPTRIMELGQFYASNNGYGGIQIGASLMDHPGTLRRIFTEMEFMECETMYQWRPDLKKPGMTLRSKAETDERCKKLVNILDNK